MLPQMQAMPQGPGQNMWGLAPQPYGQQLRPSNEHVPRLPWTMPQQGQQGAALPQLQGQEAPQVQQEQPLAVAGGNEGTGVGPASKASWVRAGWSGLYASVKSVGKYRQTILQYMGFQHLQYGTHPDQLILETFGNLGSLASRPMTG
jgi:hypothetical protein